MHTFLHLEDSVGPGQPNKEEDVFAVDEKLAEAGGYDRPSQYHGPQLYLSTPLVDAIKTYQEKNDLKVDGIIRPQGETRQTINNALLRKPRGAGLFPDFEFRLDEAVGAGGRNREDDVRRTKLALSGTGFLSPDPFDDPHGYIDRRTVDGIRAFQQANKLPNTGLMFAGSDGEAALREAVALLKRDRAPDFVAYQARKAAADMEEIRTIFDRLGLDLDAAVERYGDGNAGPRIVPAGFAGGLPRADPDAFNPRRRRERMFSPGAGGGPGQPSGRTWAPPLRAAPNTWERAPELIDPDAGGVGPPPAAAERSDPPTLAERLREPGMKGFVPWSWPDKQRELDAIVVENRGNASTQEQDHRVTQETMKRARKVEERMKCDIVHFSGARRLEADKEGPAGSDRPQKHVYRHDAEGREIRIARGSSRPDMIFVASPSGTTAGDQHLFARHCEQ